ARHSARRTCSATRCRFRTTHPCRTGCSACSAAIPAGGLRPPEPTPPAAGRPGLGRGVPHAGRHLMVLSGGGGQPLRVVQPARPSACADDDKPTLIAHRPHGRPVDQVARHEKRGYASSPRGVGPYPEQSLRPREPSSPSSALRPRTSPPPSPTWRAPSSTT